MRIVCQQTILMKYHALFISFEKAGKFVIVVCCKLYVAFYELMFCFIICYHGSVVDSLNFCGGSVLVFVLS